MDEAYATAYGALARRHWWWQARDRIVLRSLHRILAPAKGLRLLDVGCGDGRLFPALARFGAVEGIEPDPNTRSAAPSTGTVHRVPFARPLAIRGPYDVVTMLDVLEHLPDTADALSLVREVLAPGGRVLITVPALPALWTRHDTMNHHVLRFTRTGLARQLNDAGFELESVRYFFHALVLPKLAVRVFEGVMPRTTAVPLTPPALLNALLTTWFDAEFEATRWVGTWLPGSSLLAVARRSRGMHGHPSGETGQRRRVSGD